MTVRVVLPTRSILGEGPAWHPTEQALYWVDVQGKVLHRLDGDEHRRWRLPRRASAPVFRVDGVSLTTEDGVADIDLETGEVALRFAVEPDRPGNRCNEARVDRRGRLWIGTMDDRAEVFSGALYRVDLDGSVHRQVPDICISNTLAWSLDDSTLYFADSKVQAMRAYAFEPESGTVGASRPFADFAGTTDVPDGSAVDAEGCLWTALWDGGCVVRLGPDGRELRRVAVPAQRPTCVAFGGHDLRTLFVTSARVGLEGEHDGALFAFDPGVGGLPEPIWTV